MSPTIKRIDTALTNHIRTFVTHHHLSNPQITTIKARHDVMNTSQISHVMNALSSATETASKQATETINTYNRRVATRSPLHAQGIVNKTQQRLIRMNHSSVSQDISQLLLSFSTKSMNAEKSWVVLRREGNFEVGVRELARAGVFGRDGDSSRLMELAL